MYELPLKLFRKWKAHDLKTDGNGVADSVSTDRSNDRLE
jgi:hypothetical protein